MNGKVGNRESPVAAGLLKYHSKGLGLFLGLEFFLDFLDVDGFHHRLKVLKLEALASSG
jgi:hypothetical protein